MPAYMLRAIRLFALPLLVVGAACGPTGAPVPEALRARDFPLVRVDGRRVYGDTSPQAIAGSRDVSADCQNRVADGTLRISDSGRSFTFRSTMRNCSGRVLVAETNEGTVRVRNERLEFVIRNGGGPATFLGTWTDSTVAIYDLGGFLEFSRRTQTP